MNCLRLPDTKCRRCFRQCGRALALALTLAGLSVEVAAAAEAASEPPLIAPAPYAPAAPRLAVFGRALDDLGEWVEVGQLGRAWRPSGVPSDWQPYFHGSWTYTEDGWFWVTDEPWGWATYHYGRWTFDEGYGWVWVPGRVWAPAWVAWRWSAEAIGWAPLPPVGPPLSAFWTFVPAARFVGERVEETALPAVRTPLLLVKTRPSGLAPAATATATPRRAPRPRGGERVSLAGS
jgi:hypothetical protein